MKKFPLLEQMRWARDERERAVREPLEHTIDFISRRMRAVEDRLRSLEKLVGSEVGKMAVEVIGHNLANEMRRIVVEALMKSGHKQEEITLTFPSDMIRFMDPKSIERQVLDEYMHRNVPRLRLNAFKQMQESVTVLDIRIPELGFRKAIMN